MRHFTEKQGTRPAFQPAGESLRGVMDKRVKKEATAILRAEMEAFGRHTGGLGSLIGSLPDGTLCSIGLNRWEPAVLIIQPGLPGGKNHSIQSENLTGLLNLHGRLNNDEERSHLVSYLMQQLSRDSAYAPTGYLILLFLFRIGRLADGLNKAKRDLQGDKAYAFSDLLRLLDRLLRFEPSSFTPALIDEVEQFVEEINMHPFRIQERVAALRAFRLANA